ncbi:hypothetical protein [Kineothrix sedimenti]|uniref:Uncharacterized protein n=1 Tax=Kineothrix sedimenti TaxID=3123317 RepID=A0ABZ3EUC9_9FIRM
MSVKVCVFKKETNEVVACIPIENGGKGIMHKDFDFKIYGDTEPYFNAIDGKVFLKENTFGIKL